MRASLRLNYHRGTTAHLVSLYPFSVQATAGQGGPFVGLDLLAGGAAFCWDPFQAYADGQVTNPNCWVLGEPGNGKSALVKCLLWRMRAVYGGGTRGRWLAIVDPKGEYRALADRLGLSILQLAPGGSTRLNPLAEGPVDSHESADDRTLRRASMVTALIATVLERTLSQVEDAAIFSVIEELGRTKVEPTLTDVAAALITPSAALAKRLRRKERDIAAELAPAGYAVDKLLTRSLRGMFDGASTVSDGWDGPGVLLDLSAIPIDSEALPLVMVAAAGWLSQLMTTVGRQRIQVFDEAWAFLGNRHTASYLQTAFKLGRNYGVANMCVTHRPSDLGAQADDGTATAKIAEGLLADAATKVILRQAPDQLDLAARTLGLSAPERAVVAHLVRGRALWKTGARAALVHHLMGHDEVAMCDTDSQMTAAVSRGTPD
jgi:type IV secretory pathway VirB4 component